jgi:hypothetical protein
MRMRSGIERKCLKCLKVPIVPKVKERRTAHGTGFTVKTQDECSRYTISRVSIYFFSFTVSLAPCTVCRALLAPRGVGATAMLRR